MTTIDDLVRDELRTMAKYELPRPPVVRAKLDANENPYSLDPDVAEALGRELSRVPLNRYPDGDAAALRALFARELGCAPGQLVFGNGSDELIGLLVAAFSRPRPGAGGRAKIAYPVPSFVVYRTATMAAGAAPLEVPLREDFTLDATALERALVAGRPNVVFFALPNNPTGTLWPREEIVKVLDAHRDMVVVADEAYFDYSGETYLDLLPRYPHLVVMRTLSKLGLAGLRVGYLIAHEPLVAQVEKIRPPYNVGSLNQTAAAWIYAHHKDRLKANAERVVAERERLFAALGTIPGIRPFPSRANLILFRVGEPGDGAASRLWQRLADAGVLLRNFDRPGPLSGCLRVTIGTPEENDLFLEVLRASIGAALTGTG